MKALPDIFTNPEETSLVHDEDDKDNSCGHMASE